MLLLNLTLPTPAENLALDEALLDTAEENPESASEVLRLWESPENFVVLGRSSPFKKEVNHDFCSANSVPVFRRSSGGATVLAGPGCLMYAVLLDYRARPELRMLDVAHQFVMNKMMNALQSLDVPVEMQGTCDLVIKGRKVSGNALRCKRNFFVYHGTFLTDMPIEQISNCLASPTRQPEYRRHRSHEDFLGNVPVEPARLKKAIIEEWKANEPLIEWPKSLTTRLAQEKYRDSTWTQAR